MSFGSRLDLPPSVGGDLRAMERRIEQLERRVGLLGATSVEDVNGKTRVLVGDFNDGEGGNAFGLKVFDDSGAVRVQLGPLPDGSYGLGIVDGGTLVSVTRTLVESDFSEVGAIFNTASTTYLTDPSGPSVTIEVGPSGRVLASANAYVGLNSVNMTGHMAIRVDGTTDYAAGQLSVSSGIAVTIAGSVGTTRLIDGLSPGSHTFTLAHRVTTSNANFSARSIFVQPL